MITRKKIEKNCIIAIMCTIISFISTLDIIRYDVHALVYKTGHITSYTNSMTDYSKRFLEFQCVKTYSDGTTRTDAFAHYLQSASSYTNIPGLLSTNVCGNDCEDMVPQGICNMGEYILISAYCYTKEHSPVLYVMKDKTLVATIVLPYDKSMHAGGVTFDGKFVWIANGQTNYGSSERYGTSSKRVYYLKREQVIAAINESISTGAYSVGLRSSYGKQYVSLQYDPAFCSYFEGYLWCGKFSSSGTDKMYMYRINHNASTNADILTNVGDMEVPRATQGLAFYRHAGQVYLMISSSYNRYIDKGSSAHSIISYKPTDYDYWISKDTSDKDFHKGSRINDITIPLMSESLDMKNSSVFVIFEAGAREYRNDIKAQNKCDKFCELNFYKICVE